MQRRFAQRCGRLALIERLFEVVMIQVLRQLMERGEVQGGLLSGLSHPRLRNALVAMHEAPADAWTLESLAQAAGMSRSAFASAFVDAVGGEAAPKFGWTDVAQFTRLGVPAVNFGPGDALLAHTDDEHVPREAVHACLAALTAWLAG